MKLTQGTGNQKFFWYDSSWEGIIKLRNESGYILVDDTDGNLTELIDGIRAFENKLVAAHEHWFEAVKASPAYALKIAKGSFKEEEKG